MAFLTDGQCDFVAMYALLFWQEVERFRESFPTMQNSDKVLTMTAILSKYVTNSRASELIPGMTDYCDEIKSIDIRTKVKFPWALRLVQRLSLDYLQAKWRSFIKVRININFFLQVVSV